MFHTHYTDRSIESVDGTNREESAWETKNIDVCICEDCYGKGSSRLIDFIGKEIHEMEMDHFFKVRPVLLAGHTKVEDIFVYSDNKIVDQKSYGNLKEWLSKQV